MHQPSQEILDRYADVLINFALHGGEGVRKGEVVQLRVSESAKPMLVALRRAVLKAGAHPLIMYTPDDIAREFFELATEEQLAFFPQKYFRGIVDEADHMVAVISETNKHELEGIPAARIMARQRSFKPYMDWRDEKENAGRFSWTLALYGTEAMAREVGMTVEEYWEQIIKACYLDEPDPVAKWREVMAEISRVKDRLNALAIDSIRVEAEGTDLVIGLGRDRRWLAGTGRNVPSFEIYISPDWRRTEGHIQFTEPLYAYGQRITRAYLEFRGGRVVKATAEQGEEILRAMIATENADKAGEFSLTDARLSRITRFMGETLYDENVGGRYGNTHIALGRAYKDSYPGDPAAVTAEQWEAMGYNDSVVHTDIVATSDRVVTATLADGSEMVIYRDGKFLV